MSAEAEKDLFGDSDDDEPQQKQKQEDEDEEVVRRAPQAQASSSSSSSSSSKAVPDDDIFGGDSDDDMPAGKKGGDDDDIADSDDDTFAPKSKKKLGGKKKSKDDEKEGKKKKRKDKDREKDKKGKKSKGEKTSSSSGRSLKRPSRESDSTALKRDPAAAGGNDSDEYDSETDNVASNDDRRFVAKEDNKELAGVVAEYDDDEQNFDEDRPRKKQKGERGAKKELDPFSETLLSLKRPKKVLITDNDKTKLASDLLAKMDMASRKDEQCYLDRTPAVHKLNILEHVKQVISVKELQSTLLELDILSALGEWIKVKKDKTLPSLTIRSTVYDLIDLFSPHIDHLKRHDVGKEPIGVILVSLHKHREEITENKRKIKKIIDKWGTLIYKGHEGMDDGEMERAAIREAYMARQRAEEKQASQNSVDAFEVKEKKADPHKRVRTPYSNGFLYTIRPASETIEKLDVQAQQFGAARTKMLKTMKAGRGASAVGGKKLNPRAVDMSMNGRNKS